MWTYVVLIVGFAFVIKGADIFVDGTSKIAAFLRISPIVIGLTIVAFGTNTPETVISFLAATRGNSGMAVGNIIGSNILNISLVIGLMAFIFPFNVSDDTVRKEIPFALLSALTLLIMVSSDLLDTKGNVFITRSEGLILLLFFFCFPLLHI